MLYGIVGKKGTGKTLLMTYLLKLYSKMMIEKFLRLIN